MKKTKHFDIKELVCAHVHGRDGEAAWRYIQPVIIDFSDWMRERIDRPIYVNNWGWGGPMTQRGLRCPLCAIPRKKLQNGILYLSAHTFGHAVDFNVMGMTPNETRQWIEDNIDDFFKNNYYVKKIRIEDAAFAPTWVHVDFFDHDGPGIIQYIKP